VSSPFLPCHSVEVFLSEFGGSFGPESSSVATSGSVADSDSWEVRETMVMSMSSLGIPNPDREVRW
jgi:hypothetical protein